MNKSGIYKIERNGKVYIGSAVNIKGRWAVHVCLLKANKHHSIKLQRAWNKYGGDGFTFSVIEVVEDVESLVSREQHYIDLHNSAAIGFNVSPTAGSCLGRKLSDESKRKIAEKAIGRKASDETRRKMSIALRRRKGERRPEETRRRIAERAMGRVVSEETRRKMSEAMKGVERHPEHAAKIAAANKARAGIKASDEARQKMSIAAKNRVDRSLRGKDGRFYAFGAEHGVKWSKTDGGD